MKIILKEIEVKSRLIDDYTNSYIIQDASTKEAMCIDPGGDLDKIIDMLNILDAKLKYIFLTHSHMDHIQEAQNLKERLGGEILIYRKAEENINNPNINLSIMVNENINISKYARVDDKDILHVGGIELEVIYTPGHTNDSVSLYSKKEGIIFTGDTLMCMGCGRTDLPTGNKEDLKKSLKKLFKLPDETFVYPGHGIATTIKDKKERYL